MNPTYSLDYILSILALFAQLREPTVSTVSTASTVSTLSTTRYRQLQADLTHTVPPRCSETRSFPAHHGAQLCCLSRQGLRSQSPTSTRTGPSGNNNAVDVDINCSRSLVPSVQCCRVRWAVQHRTSSCSEVLDNVLLVRAIMLSS